MDEEYIGRVRGGVFRVTATSDLAGDGGYRLTRIVQEAAERPDGPNEIPLAEYEGQELRVTGEAESGGTGWIWDARIVEVTAARDSGNAPQE